MKYNTVDNDVYPLIVVYGVIGKGFSVNLVVYWAIAFNIHTPPIEDIVPRFLNPEEFQPYKTVTVRNSSPIIVLP